MAVVHQLGIVSSSLFKFKMGCVCVWGGGGAGGGRKKGAKFLCMNNTGRGREGGERREEGNGEVR